MKHFLLAILVIGFIAIPARSHAIDAWYLGGEIGHVALSGPTATAFSNTIGFGLDFGIRTNPVLDLNLALQASSHSGGSGLTLFSQTLAADLRIAEMNDFEWFVGAGPGFYFLKNITTASNFGLNFGTTGNVMVDENIRVGLNARYHAVFGSGDDYWTIMMRFGYLFDVSGA